MTRANPSATSHSGYSSFPTEEGNNVYGSFEVYWFESHEEKENGWYWHATFPGCLPDGDASGPFPTSRAAYKDALGR